MSVSTYSPGSTFHSVHKYYELHTCAQTLYFTSSDEESATQLVELVTDEGAAAHQEEESGQSCHQAEDYEHGPETPKHCRKNKQAAIRAVANVCLQHGKSGISLLLQH